MTSSKCDSRRTVQKQRYKKSIWKYIDCFSYILMLPWLVSVNVLVSSFMSTTGETHFIRYFNYLIVGPVSIFPTIVFAVPAIAGILLWFIVCNLAEPADYSYWETGKKSKTTDFEHGNYVLASVNMCLLPECFAKFNNLKFNIYRAWKIGLKILSPAMRYRKVGENECGRNSSGGNDHVISEFPSRVDFLCLQEVWERSSMWILISALQSHFSYFLYDVGKFHWSANKCALGSGLMFASRFPILAVDFSSFHTKTLVGSFTSLGLLQVKVDVGCNTSGRRKIGYIATTHLQCYQGKDPILLAELDELSELLPAFRKDTFEPEHEDVAFDLLCGDFNFDNMSPGDQPCAKHHLFDQYLDYCRIKVGQDKAWAIGTELRQIMIWDEAISTPKQFKSVLENPTARRRFILDADVEIQTMKLALLCPPYDTNGSIARSRVGGLRRIDNIIYNKDFPVKIENFDFITSLTQLTDHIPVSVKFKTFC